MRRLNLIFQRFREANLKLNPKKCKYAYESVKFLGHVVSANGIGVDNDKVDDILKIKIPNCIRDIRAFLGCAGYYRKHIQGFSLIARPLSNLKKSDQPWIWTEAREKTFNELKTRLTTTPVLRHYDEKLKT
jgi:hypothetical protein